MGYYVFAKTISVEALIVLINNLIDTILSLLQKAFCTVVTFPARVITDYFCQGIWLCRYSSTFWPTESNSFISAIKSDPTSG